MWGYQAAGRIRRDCYIAKGERVSSAEKAPRRLWGPGRGGLAAAARCHCHPRSDDGDAQRTA